MQACSTTSHEAIVNLCISASWLRDPAHQVNVEPIIDGLFKPLRGGNSQRMRDKNQQTSSWVSHPLSGNLGRNLSKVPMELNLCLLQKQMIMKNIQVSLTSLCHSALFPHSCLERSLSKWNTCTWPLSQGETNQNYRHEARKQTLRWRLWHWTTLMPTELHC